jgi:hypothetical protein
LGDWLHTSGSFFLKITACTYIVRFSVKVMYVLILTRLVAVTATAIWKAEHVSRGFHDRGSAAQGLGSMLWSQFSAISSNFRRFPPIFGEIPNLSFFS